MGARTAWCNHCLPVAQGEASGLLQAITWMHSMGYDKVIFELDCKVVVDKVLAPGADISELGAIIKDCSRLLHSLPNSRVKFIGSKLTV